MKRIAIILLLSILGTSYTNAQILIKKKAEKKANQVIDDFLFGKKKKNSNQSSTSAGESSSEPNTPIGSSPNQGEEDSYTPQPVNFGSLDLSKSVSFRVLIDMLPEKTQGFVREGKPQGARYNTQGVSFSTASKNYRNGDREMTITLNDYLGAEYFASAQTAQQFEYESTEGYSKSIEVDGIPGWISYDYGNKEGTMFLYLQQRFYATIQADNTSEEELKAAASDVKLSRLEAEISE